MLGSVKGLKLNYLCRSRRAKLTFVLFLLINAILLFWTTNTLSNTLWYNQSTSLDGHLRSLIQSNVHHNPSSDAYYAWESTKSPRHSIITSTFIKNPSRSNPGFDRCPDILSGMAAGHWVTRPLTDEEQKTIDHYLQKERGAYYIPPTYQRMDGRCGNISYEQTPYNNFMKFKSICNPKGQTPCCYKNRCTSRSIQECQCPECADERQAVHAEFAKWEPENRDCQLHNYTSSEACQLLRGANIVYIGDSFIRHVFAATAILLTGNRLDGALRRFLPLYKRDACLGMHQISGKQCKELLDEDQLLCNGTVRIRYVEVFPSKQLPKSIPFLKSLHQYKKSLIVLGFGIHDDYIVEKVTRHFLVPFMNVRQLINKNPTQTDEFVHYLMSYDAPSVHNVLGIFDEKDVNTMLKSLGFNESSIADLKETYGYFTSHVGNKNVHVTYNLSSVFESSPTHALNVETFPRLLWIGSHAPGLLKSPKFQNQNYTGVKLYNEKIFSFLKKWRVPYLDTLGFTKEAVSFDGTHYGWGVNMLKVNMIFTYLETLLWSGGWEHDAVHHKRL